MRVGIFLALTTLAWSTEMGKVSYQAGEAWLIKGENEKPLRVGHRVAVGNQIRTGNESVVEVTYDQGSVVRIGENSLVTLSGNEVNSHVQVSQGKVWANVKKMASGDFRVSTPVATAAVRGTVFRVESAEDSSSTVALYSGRVDVGPADTTKIKASAEPAKGGWGPPVEVPGPYEVSMETWIRLDPGKQINVRANGRYATTDINKQKEAEDRWILLNRQRDLLLQR